jgi:DNA-binding NarL/FixJ family response regulator
MRRAIKSLIGDLAAEIYECSDGNQALAAYRQHQPDWVLMDMRIGRTDGLVITRQITAAFPQSRIVMLADFDDESLRAAAEQAGARGTILKEDLLAIRALLKQEAPEGRGPSV